MTLFLSSSARVTAFGPPGVTARDLLSGSGLHFLKSLQEVKPKRLTLQLCPLPAEPSGGERAATFRMILILVALGPGGSL